MARARLLPVAFKFSPPGTARGVRNRLTSAFPARLKAFPACSNPNQCHVCTARRATRYAQPSAFALIREGRGGLAAPAGHWGVPSTGGQHAQQDPRSFTVSRKFRSDSARPSVGPRHCNVPSGGAGPMGTWSRGAPLLPVVPAANPGPGRWSPEPASSGGTGSDAARTARRPAVKARPGQHAQPLGFDPDDAKTAPRPAVNVPPGQHARPPGFDPDDAKTARRPGRPARGRGPAGTRRTTRPRGLVSPRRAGRPPRASPPIITGIPPPSLRPQRPGRPISTANPGPAGQRGLVPQMRRPAQPQRRPARPQQEPSWPTVIATTIRLWWERRGSRWRWAGAAALAVVVVVAAGLAVALSPSGAKAPSRHRAGGGEAPSQHRAGGGANPVLSAQAARSDAAAWIDQQVSRGTIVSCDPVMCSALLAHGFPAANLDSLRPSAPDPLASDMIAATAVLRSQFGPRLTSVYAPITVASFGTGSAQVDVRDRGPGRFPGLPAPVPCRPGGQEGLWRPDAAQFQDRGRAVAPAPARQRNGGLTASRDDLDRGAPGGSRCGSCRSAPPRRARVPESRCARRLSPAPPAGRRRAPPCWTSSAASGWGSRRRTSPRAPRSFRMRQGRAPCASSSPRPASSGC